jgi:hypothetical protein
MRVVVPLLLAFVACGGSKKPAETPEAPSEPSAASSAEAPDAEAAPSETAAVESDAGAPAAPSESPPAESPAHPVPTVTGSIDGKPFSPKMARVTHAMQKDGRIAISLDERTECGGGDLKPGEAALTMTVPWEDGYKADLGSLRGGKHHGGDISFVRVGATGKKETPASFKPTGRATIVKAPLEENSTGKMNIDLQSGDYMLSGDLDIQVCVAPKAAASAPAPAPKPAKPAKGTKKKK